MRSAGSLAAATSNTTVAISAPLADYDAAVRIDPYSAYAHNGHDNAHQDRGEYDLAMTALA
jgi:hypothetical protein